MNITSQNGFRAFVIFSTLLGFGGFVDLLFPSLLSPELQEYFAKAELTTYGAFLAIYSLIMSALGMVALVGILLYRSWARTMYVVLAVIGVILTPMFNELISSGLSAAFSGAAAIMLGMILVLMYTSPVSEYFDKT